MNTIIYIALLFFMVYLTIKNFKMIRRNKQDKGFVECYKKTISNEEDSLEYINNYLSTEENVELRNKTLVIKLIEQLKNDLDVQETLDELDLKTVICENGKINVMKFEMNSDIFLWIMTAMAKANAKGKTDVIVPLFEQLSGLEELSVRAEYKILEEFKEILLGNKNTKFITNFLIGEHDGYACDKKIISLEKRFAEAIKAYVGEELDEVSQADIPLFAKTLIGEYFMKDLGIYDKYYEKSEVEENIPVQEEDNSNEEQ